LTETARARLYIDLAALADNYRWLADQSRPAVCAAAVKSNAYGLGLSLVVRSLSQAGCTHFFVATVSEGVALRAISSTAVIFVLDGMLSPADTDIFKIRGLIPVLNSREQIAHWRPWNGPCAIMVDTGINRLGLGFADATLEQYTDLNCVYLMSHLASADTASSPLNEIQRIRFDDLKIGDFTTPKSLANSAGILLGSAFHYDMVRPGLALYGGNAGPAGSENVRQVATAYAQVLQIRTINPGETVGYNATWTASRPTRIATLGIGYADGYGRGFSNSGRVWLGECYCPVIGRISMDLTTIDITDIRHVAVGDYGEIIGPNVPLVDASAASGLSQYELLTGLGQRYERIYVE
jgi:alanine racemase